MKYYGVKHIPPTGTTPGINILRYEAPANQFVYSLPMSYSNTTYKARADLLYVNEGSGSLTVTESQPNNDLVGFVYQPGTAYVPENVFGNNVVKIESGNNIPVLTIVTVKSPNINPSDSNSFIANATTVSVSGSYTIPSNTYALVVEGTVSPVWLEGTVTLDSNVDLHILGRREEERTIEGNGKLIIFKIV